jgi:NhaP-type Na+/H+ or K+/H+ antiporter
MYGHYRQDLEQLNQLAAESAFIVRTYFFIIFGYLIDLDKLSGSQPLKFGVLILVLIFVFRMFYNVVTIKKLPIPETLVNPRGLISILLFINIPEGNKVAMANEGLLLIVIVGTGLIMTAGMMMTHPKRLKVSDK